MKKQYWITLGVIVGLILARVLTPYINSFIANKVVSSTTNHVTTNQTEHFIQDTIQIESIFSDYQYNKKMYNHFLTDYFTMNSYVFYDKNNKKYFAVQFISNYLPSKYLLKIAENAPAKCTVNKQQLNSRSYGTFDNPVLVLRLLIPDNDQRNQYSKSDARDIREYNKNVKVNTFKYLTYFTPKEEFQKMFPDKK
jgi:hypothetical protein